MKLLFVSCLLAIVLLKTKSNDIHLGTILPTSKVILNDTYWKNPRPWVRMDDILIDAQIGNLISAVNITDLTKCKDGIAFFERGGVGKRKAVLVLESPAIMRGFYFDIVIYVNKIEEADIDPDGQITKRRKSSKKRKNQQLKRNKQNDEIMKRLLQTKLAMETGDRQTEEVLGDEEVKWE